MGVLAFVDLDDTLFQTRPKCPSDVPLHVAAVDRFGQPLSFMTEQQKEFFEWLNSRAIVIPTTARNLNAFRRVRLQFHQNAILDFGAVILTKDGLPDPNWDGRVRPELTGVQKLLKEIEQESVARNTERHWGLNIRVVQDFDLGIYVIAKDPSGKGARLRALHDFWLSQIDVSRFYLHWNDNNVALVPSFIRKEFAVKFVCDHYFNGDSYVKIGVGDSLTDAPFLCVCDFAMIPCRSQLFRQLKMGGGCV